MADDIFIEVITPKEILGSTTFAVLVKVTNNGREDISGLSVEPVAFPGMLLRIGAEDEETALSELQMAKRRLVREMERQVQRAYERNRIGNLSPGQKLLLPFVQAVDGYVAIFMLGRSKYSGLVPSWATEALRIQEWDDVERLEKDVICSEPEWTFLRKAFLINKDKLKRCLSQMNEAGSRSRTADPLGLHDALPPGISASYPFGFSAPHALRPKQCDIQFRITFKKEGQQKVFQRSAGKTFIVLSSAFAVPTGSMIGAACGYFIRLTLRDSSASSISLYQLGGSILLGLVIALLTSRKPDAKKPITVEDFVGGFVIGALAGLFSQEALKRVSGLFQ